MIEAIAEPGFMLFGKNGSRQYGLPTAVAIILLVVIKSSYCADARTAVWLAAVRTLVSIEVLPIWRLGLDARPEKAWIADFILEMGIFCCVSVSFIVVRMVIAGGRGSIRKEAAICITGGTAVAMMIAVPPFRGVTIVLQKHCANAFATSAVWIDHPVDRVNIAWDFANIVVSGAMVTAAIALWAAIERMPPPRIRANMPCKKCGYDLYKNESGMCPECGTDTSPIALGEHSAKQ